MPTYVNYGSHVVEIIKTNVFENWFTALRDANARDRITIRIDRAALGNLGDVAPVGEGVSEMRINYGPGYRLYFMQRGAVLIVLLCGGDKSTQRRDIARAKTIAAEWKD